MKKFMTMIAVCMLSAVSVAQTTESLSIADFEIMAGETKIVPVNLTSTTEYVGFQFDLVMPKGVSIALNNKGRLDVKLDEDMADDHTLSAEKVADNTYRFVCFSMTNSGFYETSGTLLNLGVQAAENATDGELTGSIKDILLVEHSAEQHWFDDAAFTITCKNNSTVGGQDCVDITSARYTAYVTKFNTNFSNIEGLTAYKVTEATAAGAKLEEVEQAPMGTALILHGAEGTYTLDKVNTEIGEIADNLFKAGGNIKGDNSTIYALGNKNYGVGFYPVAKDVTIPASKGYLEISPTSEAKAFIPFGGEATGIKAVAEESTGKDIVIYNLAGQRVAKPTQSGIYIVNGKKVFINK